MKNQGVHWGILGAGNIAGTFAREFPRLRNATLVAVASRDLGKAALFCRDYSIPKSLTYDELYSDKDIQAVYIATPHNFHFEQAKNCILNGKSVLCEKPITLNDQEFSILSQLAQENKVFLMEGLWSYFLPANQIAKNWIKEGRLGKIKLIQANFGYDLDKDPEKRLYNPHLAGGALLDIGIYPIAISLFLLDKIPKKVQAMALLTHTGVDSRISVSMDFGETIVQIMVALDTLMENKMMIYGENGILEIYDYWKSRKIVLKDFLK
jgi:predicted dehydrogenase